MSIVQALVLVSLKSLPGLPFDFTGIPITQHLLWQISQGSEVGCRERWLAVKFVVITHFGLNRTACLSEDRCSDPDSITGPQNDFFSPPGLLAAGFQKFGKSSVVCVVVRSQSDEQIQNISLQWVKG